MAAGGVPRRFFMGAHFLQIQNLILNLQEMRLLTFCAISHNPPVQKIHVAALG